MVKAPIISIIVPFYNAKSTLEDCLSSISIQKDVDYEVIMVDDGSTDNGDKIAKKYASRKKNFYYIRQSNQGVSSARNTGIDLAAGDFVTFVDADDFLLPGAISKLISSVDKDVDLVIASHVKFRRFGCFKTKPKCIKLPDTIISLNCGQVLDRIDSFLSTPWAKLFRLNIIKSNTLKFDVNVPYGEDTRFVINYCRLISGQVLTTSFVVYGYALGGGASSKRFYPDIMKYDAGLLKVYRSSAALFSTSYVTELRNKFIDASLIHLYTYLSFAEARKRAIRDISYFNIQDGIDLAVADESMTSQKTFVPEDVIKEWENTNRFDILLSKMKLKIKTHIF